MTRGFWGIIKNRVTKKFYCNSDSYPSGLGKDVIFAIQNGLDKLADVFEKIIFVKNINNLDSSEYGYLLGNPSGCLKIELLEKYFAENAEGFVVEYGYLINLDEQKLILFRMGKIIADLDFKNLSYLQMLEIYEGS